MIFGIGVFSGLLLAGAYFLYHDRERLRKACALQSERAKRAEALCLETRKEMNRQVLQIQYEMGCRDARKTDEVYRALLRKTQCANHIPISPNDIKVS